MLVELGFTKEGLGEFKVLQDQILKSYDSYLILSIANIYYEWSTRVRFDPQEQGNLLKKAMEKYIFVLENDESNVFAAVGVANVLAEHGKVVDAIEILKGINEACPKSIQVPNVLVNLAHLNMANENYEAAIPLYIKALERLPPGRGDLEIELFLAKAYFANKAFE